MMKRKFTSRKRIALLLAAAICAETLITGSSFLLKTAAVPTYAAENTSSYDNSYVTDTVASSERPGQTGNGNITDTAGIYYINNVTDFIEFARFSQNNEMSGKTVYIATNFNSVALTADFPGIGSRQHPFAGTFRYQGDNTNGYISLNGCSALFNYISTAASVSRLTVVANGSHGCFAQTLVVSDGGELTLSSISVSGTVSNSYSDCAAGLLFGEVETAEDNTPASGTVDISGVTLGDADITNNDGSAGYLIGSVMPNVSLTLNYGTDLTVGSGVTLDAIAGNAGLVSGTVSENATLTLGGKVSVNADSSESVKAVRYYNETDDVGGNAGAIVGRLDSGAALSSGDISVQNITIGAGNGAGAVFGSAENASLPTSAIKVTGVSIKGGAALGGYVGYIKNPTAALGANLKTSVTITPTNDVRFGYVGAGGIIGKLDLDGSDAEIDLSASAENSILAGFGVITPGAADSDPDASEQVVTVGGLVGYCVSDNIENTLSVTGNGTTAVAGSRFGTNGSSVRFFCAGGVVGLADTGSYISVSSLKESTSGVSGTAGTPDAGDVYAKNYGGIAGFVNDGAVLDVDDIIVTGGYAVKVDTGFAGGVVGHIGMGSVLRFSGSTILGNFAYGNTESGYASYSGQLVGYQDNSLVFAENGWTLTRNTGNDKRVDDIGNYGEVIRNSATVSAVSFDTDSHTASVAQISGASASAVIVTTVVDYVSLAITLNSRGYFSGVSGIDNSNYKSLLENTTITFADDIPLSGTGVLSLTRNDTADDAFNGTVAGAGHTLTLAYGESYYAGGTHGNGEIYGNPYSGMFGVVSDLTVENLTIAGVLTYGDVNNVATPSNNREVNVGAVAGMATGTVNFSNVTVSATITEKNICKLWVNTAAKSGGFIGYYTGDNLTANECAFSGKMNVRSRDSGNDAQNVYTGGFIGSAYASTAVMTFNNTSLSGNIEYSSTSVEPGVIYSTVDAKVGGLIGSVVSAAATPDAVKININGIASTMKIEINGNSTAGGFLGYYWDKTEVTLAAGTGDFTTNTFAGTYTQNGNGAFGGLLYRINGKLSLEDTSITTSFTTPSAASGAICVCQGRDMYMVVQKDSVSIAPVKAPSGTYDDLARITKLDSTDDVTANQYGGIISIETGAGTGSTTIPWVYSSAAAENNTNTRYYYNVEALDKDHLPIADYNRVVGGTINSKEEFLLWHILNYTSRTKASGSANAAYYFRQTEGFANAESYTVNDDMDMSGGFCLYPTSVANTAFDFGDNTVTFSNTGVESLDPGNTSSHHYMLHTGLFYNVNGNLSVSNIKLSGNVGMANGFSGAIILGSISGSNAGTSTYTVYTLDISGVELNNLSVNGADSGTNKYAPLLVNQITNCVTANFTDISQSGYTETGIASSLIGNVGGTNKTKLNIKFSQIALDGTTSDSLFYRSSLLNTLSYQTDGLSSGIYNFNEGEDWNENTTNRDVPYVTYGSELSNKTNYYDTSNFVNPITQPSTTPYNFTSGNYIPYVYSVDIENSLYPLDVNVKNGNLNVGCGTYEDPYIIKYENQLTTLTNFINNDTILENWIVNRPNSSFCANKDNTSHTAYNSNDPDFASKVTGYDLRHAYYVISSDITLKSGFLGIGTKDNPFAGVIVGEVFTDPDTGETRNQKITIPQPPTDSFTSLGFIDTGIGCVIKDLDIEYSGSFTVASSNSNTNNTYYFGGIIGQVIGGDNVIDNCQVTLAENSTITVSDRMTYIGGYVGLNMAGGVIFRNMGNKTVISFTGINTGSISGFDENIQAEDSNWFYVNPFVGKTLDAFAVAERDEYYDSNDTTDLVDNTNKNYRIHTMTGNNDDVIVSHLGGIAFSPSVTRYYNLVTIENEEGLFVYAAAANSGALSTGMGRAYSNDARRRAALYNKIGNITSSEDSDYALSLIDNTEDVSTTDDLSKTPVSMPYLVYYYMTNSSGRKESSPNYLTGYGRRTNISLESNTTFDMATKFGNGFRGIGGQYDSYANAPNGATKYGGTNDRNRPLTADYSPESFVFNGNGSTVILGIDLPQYKTDTYRMNGLSLFNNANNTNENLNNSTYTNCTILGNVSTTLYQNSTGAESYEKAGTGISTAGLISSFPTNNNSGTSALVTIKNITVGNDNANSFVARSYCVSGGVLGQAINRGSIVMEDCTYKNISITARVAAGGLVGYTKIEVAIDYTKDASLSDCVITDDGFNSAMTANDGFGGMAGNITAKITINNTGKNVSIKNVTIKSVNNPKYDSNGFGGIIGSSNSIVSVNKIAVTKLSILAMAYSDGLETSTEEVICGKIPAVIKDNLSSSAGGIIAYLSGSGASAVTGCSVSESLIVGINGSGGVVGRSSRTDTITDTTVVSTRVFSYANIGGIVGYKTGECTLKNDSVDGCSVASATLNSSSVVGGLISYTKDTATITNCFVNNTNVTANLKVGGFIAQADSTVTVTCDDDFEHASVSNCVLTLSNSSVNAVAADILAQNTSGTKYTYMKNITCIDNVFASTTGKAYNSGSLIGYHLNNLYATNVLVLADSSKDPTGTNNGVLIGKTNVNSATRVVAVHTYNSSLKDIGNRNNASKVAIVYSDYYGTNGSGTDSATLGSQVSVSPSNEWVSGSPWYGDGIGTAGSSSIAECIFYNSINGYYEVPGTDSILTSDELIRITDYSPSVPATADVPLLYVHGSDIDALITAYADLLTNGGFSAFESVNPTGITVSSESFCISEGIISDSGNEGSIAYTNGAFGSSHYYDNLGSDNDTFTLVTVTYSNPESATANAEYSAQFAVYYPQILKVQVNASLKDYDDHFISDYLNISNNVNIAMGGTFSAYIEYVYNELCKTDDWNYEKYIRIVDNDGVTPLQLPKDTQFTLVDLNSADSSGYKSYYYTAENDIATIQLSNFTRTDYADDGSVLTETFVPTFLSKLPSVSDTNVLASKIGDVSDSIWNEYGAERYIVYVTFPESGDYLKNDDGSDMKSMIYNVSAGVEHAIGDEKNVELTGDDTDNLPKIQLTIWNEPLITSDISIPVGGNSTISTTEPIEAQIDVSVVFPDGYANAMRNGSDDDNFTGQFGMIRLSLTDAESNKALPAGTIVKIGSNTYNLTDSMYYFDEVISNDSGNPLNLIESGNLTNGDTTYTLSKEISLDFSNVSAADLAGFTEDYKLNATFYLSTNAEHPTNGRSDVDFVLLHTGSYTGASITVNVDSDSLLNIGINTKDHANDTNNGKIGFNVLLSLENCTDEQISSIRTKGVILTFNLAKKHTEGVLHPYNAISDASPYLTLYNGSISDDNSVSASGGTVTVSLTKNEVTTLCDNREYTKSLSIAVETPTALADYANYKYTVSTTLHGNELSDYFIYTLAMIHPEYLDGN